MARQYKCVYCGEPISETENKIPVKNRYAHERCFNVSLKATDKKQKENKQKKLAERKTNSTESAKKVTKPQSELKEGLSEEEYKEKKLLFNKIREIQMTSELSAKTYKLIEDYIKKYDFTYLGMRKALIYFYDIECNPKTEDCVGIIPYVYDKAKIRFENIEQAADQNSNINIKKVTKTIKITPKKNRGEFIDITKIGQ